ncbi:aminotransferase class I/II-fold pyridoxal phosphate-dependent enzyme [candidate division KSB1 bacterium]|nr:aminotransferase class I/II-fold pyridoxal phosphate-dependent enzyme [candidate division KSB1 bacterium]
MERKNVRYKTQIPFSVPSLGREELRAVAQVLESRWITTGPRTKAFEQKFARYLGAENAVAVNSCTAGLHLALVAYGIGAGDEVITTPYTFAATGEVILHAGAVPVFTDIEPAGFNIDPEKIEQAITPRTKAIIPVHFAGEPCRMDKIVEIALRHNLIIIEDAAHALGARYRDKMIGSFTHASAFSFYATKNLTTGEGGMVTTNDSEIADRIRMLSLHGLSHDAWNRYSALGKWYYEITELGFKYNMSDIQAALGLVQLERFDEMQKKRKELAQLYYQLLIENDHIILPPRPVDSVHAWHLFVIRLKGISKTLNRNFIIRDLNKQGIGTSVHFIPLHIHPFYQNNFGYEMGDFPMAETTFESVISLPLYPDMTETDVLEVVNALQSSIYKNEKTDLKHKVGYAEEIY